MSQIYFSLQGVQLENPHMLNVSSFSWAKHMYKHLCTCNYVFLPLKDVHWLILLDAALLWKLKQDPHHNREWFLAVAICAPKHDWDRTDSEVCGIHLFHIHSICSWWGMSCLFFPFVLSQGFRGAHSNRLADIYLHTVVLGICVSEPQLVILLEQVQP